MLQPLQLKDVSTRYANEIAELRDFLAKSGLSLNTPQSISAVAAQLHDSRAFRRDLTSHFFVIHHSGNRQPSYSDLLGMLALAAAGPTFATAADDNDAHDLLRFLMQTRSNFDPTSPALRPTPPLISVQPIVQESFARRIEPEPETSLSFEMPNDEEDRKPIVWIGAAACVLAVLLIGLTFHHHTATSPATPAVISTTTPSSPSVLATKDTGPVTQHSSQAPTPTAHTTPRATPYTPIPEPPNIPNTPAQAWKKPSPGTPMTSSLPTPPSPGRSYAAPRRASSTTRPSTLASTRVPARTPNHIPAPVPITLGNNTFPRSAANTTNTPYTRFDTRTSTRPTVRPTSLGIMAANVTYSPAPVYPTAAAAAHVQGEVKLEAEVDRNGNVVSTRVISGPPLLRDAAADAVQRWLYRPYLYNGKPVAMNASVVMDFELPSL